MASETPAGEALAVAGGALAAHRRPGARGPRAPAAAWPGGARCAIALSFDSDHDTNELRDGGKSIGRLGWGQYGNRVGVPRILSVLARYGVPATFYVPAVSALLYPDEQRRVVGEGHEIGLHGWIHELNSTLVVRRRARSDVAIGGHARAHCRRPSDRSADAVVGFQPAHAAHRAGDGAGVRLSLMADEDCYELLLDGKPTGVIELPVEWVRDDAVYLMMHSLPVAAAVHAAGRRARHLPSRARRRVREGGIFQLAMHPHVIGYRSRIWILEEIIRHARPSRASGSRRTRRWSTGRSGTPGDEEGRGPLDGLGRRSADKEKEFNRWYNEEHLTERLCVPGFLSARATKRSRAAPSISPSTSWRVPAVLEIRGVQARRDQSDAVDQAVLSRRHRHHVHPQRVHASSIRQR